MREISQRGKRGVAWHHRVIINVVEKYLVAQRQHGRRRIKRHQHGDIGICRGCPVARQTGSAASTASRRVTARAARSVSAQAAASRERRINITKCNSRICASAST